LCFVNVSTCLRYFGILWRRLLFAVEGLPPRRLSVFGRLPSLPSERALNHPKTRALGTTPRPREISEVHIDEPVPGSTARQNGRYSNEYILRLSSGLTRFDGRQYVDYRHERLNIFERLLYALSGPSYSLAGKALNPTLPRAVPKKRTATGGEGKSVSKNSIPTDCVQRSLHFI